VTTLLNAYDAMVASRVPTRYDSSAARRNNAALLTLSRLPCCGYGVTLTRLVDAVA